jgi:hypothetical protein
LPRRYSRLPAFQSAEQRRLTNYCCPRSSFGLNRVEAGDRFEKPATAVDLADAAELGFPLDIRRAGTMKSRVAAHLLLDSVDATELYDLEDNVKIGRSFTPGLGVGFRSCCVQRPIGVWNSNEDLLGGVTEVAGS